MPNQSGRYVEVSAAAAERLRGLIVERMREEPGFTNARLEERAGVSQPTVTDLLAARPKRYRRDVLSKVSNGLGWTPTSIEEIVAGGNPSLDGAGPPDRLSVIEARLDRIEASQQAILDELRGGRG